MAKEGLGLEITELRLGLPGGGSGSKAEAAAEAVAKNEKKRGFAEMEGGGAAEVAKNQVVGWPPVCSYRKKNSFNDKLYVKVSMDGAPFLRKIDLNTHKGYPDLALALEKLFGCFGMGK